MLSLDGHFDMLPDLLASMHNVHLEDFSEASLVRQTCCQTPQAESDSRKGSQTERVLMVNKESEVGVLQIVPM